MGTGGLTDQGLAALDSALAGRVAAGEVPGVAALVARGGDTHVFAAGQATLGGSAMRRDSIFRIASLTKPVTGVAAMTLIQDGAMALDDPVDRWLPELADRRVLRAPDADLTDTVPARRSITVQDVLSFRLGFGNIFAPGPPPIVTAAEGQRGLRTLGPPWPPCELTPDQWIAALGSLPLIDQPGERWRYNTGATVAGILISRVAGEPLADVLAKRVLEPLGMTDTAFHVPAAKRDRFTSMYMPPGYQALPGLPPSGPGELTLLDAPGGWYSRPPALPDGASGLVSTVDDFGAFASMLASGGGGVLSAESVALMLRDRTTEQDKAENPWFFAGQGGWGLMMAVPAGESPAGPYSGGSPAGNPDGTPRGYGWDGGSGTTWRTDPASGLTGILLTQRMMGSPEPMPITRDFWRAAYAAIAG